MALRIALLALVLGVSAALACTSQPEPPSAPDWENVFIRDGGRVEGSLGADMFAYTVDEGAWSYAGPRPRDTNPGCYSRFPADHEDPAGAWELRYAGWSMAPAEPTGLDLWVDGEDVPRHSWSASADIHATASGAFVVDGQDIWWVASGTALAHEVAVPGGAAPHLAVMAPWGALILAAGDHSWEVWDHRERTERILVRDFGSHPRLVPFDTGVVLHDTAGLVVLDESGPGEVSDIVVYNAVAVPGGFVAFGPDSLQPFPGGLPGDPVPMPDSVRAHRSGHGITAFFMARDGTATRVLVFDAGLQLVADAPVPTLDERRAMRPEGTDGPYTDSSGNPYPPDYVPPESHTDTRTVDESGNPWPSADGATTTVEQLPDVPFEGDRPVVSAGIAALVVAIGGVLVRRRL